MDDLRRRIKARVDSKGLSLSALSKKIGKNHAYLQQFLAGRTPKDLPERVRHLLAAELEVNEAELRSSDLVPPPAARHPTETEMSDGQRIEPSAAPEMAARFLAPQVKPGSMEAWRITADTIDAAGYLAGDFVVVDLKRAPMAGDVVLAELIDGSSRRSLFRVNAPPYLMAAQQGRPTIRPALVDNERTFIRGVVIGQVRVKT